MKYNTIYHLSDTDLDGYGAQYMTRYVSSIYSELKVVFENGHHSDLLEKLNKTFSSIAKNRNEKSLLLITDISISENIESKINKFINGNKDIDLEVKVLDHHRSNENIANRNEWYVLNFKKCSASMNADFMSEFIRNKDVIKHLQDVGAMIQAHDLWEENSEYFNKANLLADQIKSFYFPDFMGEKKREFLFNYIYTYFELSKNFDEMHKIDMSLPIIMKDALILSGVDGNIVNKNISYKQKLYNYFSKEFEKNDEIHKLNYIENNKEFVFKAVFNMNSECWQYFSHFYLENNDIDFIVNVKQNGILSFRSMDKVDVNKIAFDIGGGGGHMNAAAVKIQTKNRIFSINDLKKEIDQKLQTLKII